MPINSTTKRAPRRTRQETVALHIKKTAVPSSGPAFTAPPKRKAELVVRNPRRRKATVTAVMPVGGPAQKIDSPVRDVILAADWALNGRPDPEIPPFRRDFIRNAFKPLTQRFAGFTFASTVYRLTQGALLVAAAMTMIGFNRRMTNEPDQVAPLPSVAAPAKIDSVRQEELRRLVTIIDRFNPAMNPELQLSLAAEIYAMSRRYPRLEVELICAVITHESAKSWNPEAVSFAGAMGLMQLLPSTADGLAQQEGIAWTSAENILFNPIYNVRLGCRYLASLIARFGVEGGLAGYNGGPVQAGRWLRQDDTLHPETADYVPQVMKKYREFQQARPQKSEKMADADTRDFPKG